MRIPRSTSKSNRLQRFLNKGQRRDRLPWLDFALAGVFVVIFAVAAGSVHEAVFGISRTVDTPDNILLIELLDCSSDGRFSNGAAEQIEGLSDRSLEIEVVNRDRLHMTQKMSSFIIARSENKKAAEELARRLGLNPDDVVIRPLEHENGRLQASLVLGDDFDPVRLQKNPKEET